RELTCTVFLLPPTATPPPPLPIPPLPCRPPFPARAGTAGSAREAREQKNSIGSVDSTGVAVGERIRDRVQEDLRAVLEAACEGTGETPEAPADRALADAWESLEALANLPLDTSGVEDEWWGPLSGDHEELRLHDTYLAFCLSSSRLLSFLPSQVCNTSCSSCSRATEENRA
ncbi:unnamed protein product, partial [Prorocentrum cordatum]